MTQICRWFKVRFDLIAIFRFQVNSAQVFSVHVSVKPGPSELCFYLIMETNSSLFSLNISQLSYRELKSKSNPRRALSATFLYHYNG